MRITSIMIASVLLLVMSLLLLGSTVMARAEGPSLWKSIVKEKTIKRTFNEANPEGTVDLKKIVEEELEKPAECDETLVTCQIKEVSFEITLKKEWRKINLGELSDYDFATSLPQLENAIDQLTKSEIVVLQEALDRRGLLTHLDGSKVKERGFFGSLTWLGLIRLAQIKGLNPSDPQFNVQLRDKVNELIEKMAKDKDYIANHALPKKEEMTPVAGDPLHDLWRKQISTAKLAETSERVDAGSIPLDSSVDVNIDGFLNVERVQD